MLMRTARGLLSTLAAMLIPGDFGRSGLARCSLCHMRGPSAWQILIGAADALFGGPKEPPYCAT
jgi:hypothetical protein